MLKDVAMLTSLLMFGEARAANLNLSEGEDRKRLARDVFPVEVKVLDKQTTYMSWVTYFIEGSRMNNPCQVDAFLPYWL